MGLKDLTTEESFYYLILKVKPGDVIHILHFTKTVVESW